MILQYQVLYQRLIITQMIQVSRMKCGRERREPELTQQPYKRNSRNAEILRRFGNTKCFTAFDVIW